MNDIRSYMKNYQTNLILFLNSDEGKKLPTEKTDKILKEIKTIEKGFYTYIPI